MERRRQPHQVGVGHEGEANSSLHHVLHLLLQHVGQVAQGPEDGEARHEGCQAVEGADEEDVENNILVERVVAGQGRHGGVGVAEGEEDLSGGGHPHAELAEHTPIRVEVELDSLHGSVQRGGPDEQDDDDEVGEGGGEVDNLPTGLDPLHGHGHEAAARREHLEKTEEVDGPGDGEAEGEQPGRVPPPELPQAGGLGQHAVHKELLRQDASGGDGHLGAGGPQGGGQVEELCDARGGVRTRVAVARVAGRRDMDRRPPRLT